MITDRGEEAFVLMSIKEYRRLHVDDRSLAELLSMDEDIDFEPEPLRVGLKVPDL